MAVVAMAMPSNATPSRRAAPPVTKVSSNPGAYGSFRHLWTVFAISDINLGMRCMAGSYGSSRHSLIVSPLVGDYDGILWKFPLSIGPTATSDQRNVGRWGERVCCRSHKAPKDFIPGERKETNSETRSSNRSQYGSIWFLVQPRISEALSPAQV